MRARSGDADLQLLTVSVGVRHELTLAARSQEEHVIRRGWLTVATRAPCTGGAEAQEIIVDQQSPTDPRWPAGTHQIRVRFDNEGGGYPYDVVVDLQIDKGACARVPAVSQSVPMTPAARNAVLIVTDFTGNGDIWGMRGNFVLGAGAGRWTGPVLTTVSSGIAVALCSLDVCGQERNGDGRSGWGIPVLLDARLPFGQAHVGGLTAVGLLGARYTFVSVKLPGLDGDRRFQTHGFHALIGVGYNDSMKGPFRELGRGPLIELSLPVGVQYSPDAPGHPLVFSVGLAMRLVSPI